jgi:hypothetical protein
MAVIDSPISGEPSGLIRRKMTSSRMVRAGRTTMHHGHRVLLMTLLGLGATCQAAEGLAVPESAWQRWQARVTVSTYDTSPRLAAASLVGDYYFRGLRLGHEGTAGGFRATSGLVLGAGTALLGAAGVPSSMGRGLSLGHFAMSPLQPGNDPSDASNTRPYLGLGYTSVGAAGGWGFTADVGVVAHSGTDSAGFGRAPLGAQGLDAAIRNLRLTPVLQLGVRYSF